MDMMDSNVMVGNSSMSTAMGAGNNRMMGHNMMDMNQMSNDSGMMDDVMMHTGKNGTYRMMMMQLYFTLGESVTIIFKQWQTNNLAGLLVSCFALFALSVLYEGLKVGRQVLLTRIEQVSADVYANEGQNGVEQKAEKKVSGEVENQADANKATVKPRHGLATHKVVIVRPVRRQLYSLAHLIQTILHMIQVFLGYLLMLAFMTYNAWICIAVVLGSGLGYLLFGWKTATLVSSGYH